MRVTLAAVILVAVTAAMIWWTSRPPALYTTDLRVAVMPLKNKAHPAQDVLTDGLTEVVCQVLDQAARIHDSMWLVPNRLVLYANIAEDGQARNSFGVNRIVTGKKKPNAFKSVAEYVEFMQEMLKTSRQYLGDHVPPLEMREIEHSLCEFDKYTRVKNGEGRPRSIYRKP